MQTSSRTILRNAVYAAAHARCIAAPACTSVSRQRQNQHQQSQRLPTRSLFSLSDISKLASGLSPSGPQSSGIESDGESQRFHARKILPYTQAQLYSIVSDIPAYSTFIPWCQSSQVLAALPAHAPANTRRQAAVDWTPGDEAFDVEAELRVGFGGLEERYVSKVVGRPFESVTATASESTPLFKSLISTWSFSPASSLSPHPSNPPSTSQSSSPSSGTPGARLPNSLEPPSAHQGPTLLTIDLAFVFANPLHRIASQAVLPKVADKMVEAFERRCLEVWGKGRE